MKLNLTNDCRFYLREQEIPVKQKKGIPRSMQDCSGSKYNILLGLQYWEKHVTFRAGTVVHRDDVVFEAERCSAEGWGESDSDQTVSRPVAL